MLCFSLLLFISNSVSAIDQDHSPPGIEMQYDIPDVVLAETFNVEKYKLNTIERVSSPVMICKPKIKKGSLCDLKLWQEDLQCIFNNASFSDNSLYVLNHLMYETSIPESYSQWTIPVNKHGMTGIETAFRQISRLS